MPALKQQIAALPPLMIAGQPYLSLQAVTNTVAASLYPGLPTGQIDAARYQAILETADCLCRELGYAQLVKLTPPTVLLSDIGLYWSNEKAASSPEPEPAMVHTDAGRVGMIEEGLLLDTRLSQLGLDEVTRQHFKIPVTASDKVIDLMQRAVASAWPNDFKGLWHDILGMCVVTGKDISPTERQFSVIIRGVGRQRYWRFKAYIQEDNHGSPYLRLTLAEETAAKNQQLFALGHIVMTPGAAALGVNFAPYLTRHGQGDWGDLDPFDVQQNNLAVKDGYRILSAYTVPFGDGETEKIWIITEADRSATTVLLPSEY